MSNIIGRIEKIIEQKKLSKAEFARLMGISRASLYTISDDSLKFSTIEKAAKILGVSVSYLIDTNNEEKNVLQDPSPGYGKKLTYKLIDVETVEIDNKKGLITILLKK